MPETRFTKGPWEAVRGECGGMLGLMNHEGKVVAMLGVEKALNPANIALIKAAPGLYEILDELTTRVESLIDKWCEGEKVLFTEQSKAESCLEDAKAILAKARGETDGS